MARTIPRAAVDEFTRQLNLVSESMRAKLTDQLMQIDFSAPGAIDVVKDLMQTYCGAATDSAALLAAQFYDAAREYSIGSGMDAVANSQRVAEATNIATVGIIDGGKTAQSIIDQLTARLDYEVKRAAGDCVFYNGSKDPASPHYARIPAGSETCQFCLMLASRGFVYSSAKSAGELDHYHANCDCRVTPGWGSNPQVEGYDPEAIYDKWQEEMTATAEARAKKNDTTVEEERKKIYAQLKKSAEKANKRNRVSTTSPLYTRLRQEITDSTAESNFGRAEKNISRLQSRGDITGGQAQALRIAIRERKKSLGI